jgi:cytoskeleton protein RodZ
MDQQSMSNEISQPVASLGALLRKAREAKGLTQQDVSNNLRFSVKQIDALENNQFDAFPDVTMTRGFIRSYAKYLEIDAEPLLVDYRSNSAGEQKKVIVVKSSMQPVALTEESWPWMKYILVSIVVLLLLLAWMFYVEFMPQQTSDVSGQAEIGLPQIEQIEEASVTENQLAALPEVALPAAERTAEPDTNARMQDVATTQTLGLPINVTSAQTATVPAAPAQTSVQASAQTSVSVVPNAKTMILTFTGQSWVSVTDKSGKLVYEKLSQSGAQDTVTAVPPLNVVIGNATVTKLQYGGQDIDLSASIKNNVARITLE